MWLCCKAMIAFLYALVRLSLATDVSEENHDEVVTLIFFIQPTETRFKAMLF